MLWHTLELGTVLKCGDNHLEGSDEEGNSFMDG